MKNKTQTVYVAMKIRCLVLTLFILSSGCTSTGYIPLDRERRNTISELDVYPLVVQDEATYSTARAEPSDAFGGGGLLVAVVRAGIEASKGEGLFEAMMPLLDASDDFDYRPVIAASINKRLGESFKLSGQRSTASSVMLTKERLRQRVGELSRGEAFLYLSTEYSLTADFKALEVAMEASLYMGKGKPGRIANEQTRSKVSLKPDYRNILIYQSDVYGEGGGNSIDVWSKRDAGLFKKEMRKSAEELAKLLHYDLTQHGGTACLDITSVNIHTGGKVSGVVAGWLVRDDDERVHIRGVREHRLYSLLDRPPKRKTVVRRRDRIKGTECLR